MAELLACIALSFMNAAICADSAVIIRPPIIAATPIAVLDSKVRWSVAVSITAPMELTTVCTEVDVPANLIKLLFAISIRCENVGIVRANSSLIVDAALEMELITTSAVNCPALAIWRRPAVPTPRPSAIILPRRGACSITERNSSPRNTPDCRPCENWIIAAVDSAVVAPETIIALLIVSVICATCLPVTPYWLSERSIRA